ncbi:hypothetical protein HPB50_006301 [Hyalomma asiaticum]|uniref:Uncharacterized protein n=1 Tax=Hyalomma asiaticum TaxID=266040 RepID=A0ACB7SEI0_HYAAI|nr:hypothetical protein HPB50_006301 [Hyalomma asiaticum]
MNTRGFAQKFRNLHALLSNRGGASLPPASLEGTHDFAMEGEIGSPEQAVENAANTTATAAVDTTPPAPTDDGETSLSNDEGSAWVLQGAKTSELHGKTTQHKPMKSRPPHLPLHDYKAILRPLGGLCLDQWTRPALTRDIGVAAGLPPIEGDRLVFRLRPEQNLAVVSTPHEHIALNLYSVQHLHNSCNGIIHGVDPGTSPSELMDHLVAPGNTVLQARMMGKTSTALITFEGLQVPHYIRYYGAEYRCYVHRPRKQVCTVCLQLGHRYDHCPTPNCVTCKICGVDNPTSEHSCTPKCRSCGGDHPTTDTGCPARIRPPLNKDRVRKALQQEQQQRDIEHHPTPSSLSQGDLTSSKSPFRRRTRSKARARAHSRTGSQPPPAKRTDNPF